MEFSIATPTPKLRILMQSYDGYMVLVIRVGVTKAALLQKASRRVWVAKGFRDLGFLASSRVRISGFRV